MSASRDKNTRDDQPNPKNQPNSKTQPNSTSQAGQQDASDNRIKDPQDWVTGDEPMTGAQESYLKTLSEQVHDPEAFDPSLDKAEASQRIDDLKHKRDGQG